MTNTTRLGLTYPPVAGSSIADVPTDMQTFLNQIDPIMVAYSTGIFSARPAASALAGKVYWATDYKRSYWSDGTTWYDIQPPVGMIQAFPTITPPDATWLLCDGASLLRATYPALFGLIGVVYGSVDSTHFNVPDLRGRAIVSPDASAGRIVTDPHTIAGVGGLERITLSAAEAAQKAVNTVADGAHTHGFPSVSAYVGNGPGVPANVTTGGGGYTQGTQTDVAVPATHTHAISGAAATSSHENMPPFLVLQYMIKT